MIQRAEDMGLAWNGRGPAPVDVLLNTIAEPVTTLLPDFIEELQRRLGDWVQNFLPYHANCIAPAEATTSLTRFNHLVRVTSQPLPPRPASNFRGFGRPCSASLRPGLVKPSCTFFPRDALPNGNGWPSGVTSKTGSTGLSKDEKNALYEAGKTHLPGLRSLLNSANGTLIRLLARSAFLLNPVDGFDGMPLDSPLRLDPLADPLPSEAGDRGTYVSADLKFRCSATFRSFTRRAIKFSLAENPSTTCMILTTCSALLPICCWPGAPTSAASLPAGGH